MRSIDVNIGGKTYTLNKFKATVGRRIVAQYPLTAMPKMASYDQNEEVMLLLMSHVEVHTSSGLKIPLTTKDLVDNHVESWDDLVSIEYQTLKFNCPFMQGTAAASLMETIKDVASHYLVDIVEKAIGMAMSGQVSSEE